MQFLADENFRFDVIEHLKSLNNDVKRVVPGSSDTVVSNMSKKENRIILTHDTDFAITLKFPPKEHPGILILRTHPPSFEKITKVLKKFFSMRSLRQIKGKTFLIEETSFLEIE